MSDRVRLEITDGVADVSLNRPDKLNSLDPAMFEALVEAGRAVAADPAVRAVVLSGQGRAFCAGLDFGSFQAMQESDPGSAASSLVARGQGPANRAQLAAWVWREVPVPVIAAVHGYAYGGGLQIALGADIRLVAHDAQLSVMEVQWGLIPDMAGPTLLRHLVRLDVLKELTFTGRIVDGVEAVELGLATGVSERPYYDALELARQIAARSPDAIRAGKHLLDTIPDLSVADSLKLEESLQLSLMGAPNQVEAVRARFEKREPAFADPAEA
ncbi:MAG TPA: crotonase/enoyl-CoA hydratase family protein [Thermoanaerobaculia bacterium]|nr:crotonase/enoyl-CoA hydratase family protein [Thermoanaerobaculia bacterium]